MSPLTANRKCEPLLWRRKARGRLRQRAYTLIELLIVIALMGILAALLLPQFEPSTHEQLQGAAQIIAGDIAYARNLAVSHDSKYRLTFHAAANSYTLQHTGTNHLLDVLPLTPYRTNTSTPDQQVTLLEALPHIGAAVEVVGIQVGGNATAATGMLEFTSLGGLQGAEPVTIWLACGTDQTRRYLPLTVAPVTGLCEVGEFVATPP